MARNHSWAGWSAIAAVLLFAAGNAIWAFDQPAPDASGAEVVDFYTDTAGRIEVGGLMSLTSIAIFGVFAAALRSVLVELESDELFANIAFAGAILGLAAGLGAEGVNMAAALRAEDGQLTEDLALALFDVSYVFGSSAAGIGFGLMTFGIGAAALRSGALLPRWVAIVAVVLGVALITPLTGWVLGEYAVGPSCVLLLFLGARLVRGELSVYKN